jgi:hypothetical protein
MKIIAIGDLHGKDCWKAIDPLQYDRIVFIGDYVDSSTVADEDLVINLEEIIELKARFADKVVLLLGNHDIQYLDFPKYRNSGFNDRIRHKLTDIFRLHQSSFKVAEQYGSWLFTHAGITNGFFHATFDNSLPSGDIHIADYLNQLNESADRSKLHMAGASRGGSYPYSGITWADMRETAADYLTGYHQVVGHTRVNDIISFSRANSKGIESSITYIDVLDSMTKFYEVEILLDQQILDNKM